jgi:hypothetical protein
MGRGSQIFLDDGHPFRTSTFTSWQASLVGDTCICDPVMEIPDGPRLPYGFPVSASPRRLANYREVPFTSPPGATMLNRLHSTVIFPAIGNG